MTKLYGMYSIGWRWCNPIKSKYWENPKDDNNGSI